MIPFFGKMPVCLNLCVEVLQACPGFTFDDISGPCSKFSVPPLCAYPKYNRFDAIPDPLGDEDEDASCPDPDEDQDIGSDPTLFEPLTPPTIVVPPPDINVAAYVP